MGEFEITGSRILGLAEQISSCGQEVKRQEGRAADILRQVRFQETEYRGSIGLPGPGTGAVRHYRKPAQAAGMHHAVWRNAGAYCEGL